ncbi:hypothetical protein VNO77_18607 [Canavalia gladiata]|uniref:Uncharacterized protein n=1 Tax=Canavalia gladiata TaxID=3824 RepID=A0AAN9QJT2_CANGL
MNTSKKRVPFSFLNTSSSCISALLHLGHALLLLFASKTCWCWLAVSVRIPDSGLLNIGGDWIHLQPLGISMYQIQEVY